MNGIYIADWSATIILCRRRIYAPRLTRVGYCALRTTPPPASQLIRLNIGYYIKLYEPNFIPIYKIKHWPAFSCWWCLIDINYINAAHNINSSARFMCECIMRLLRTGTGTWSLLQFTVTAMLKQHAVWLRVNNTVVVSPLRDYFQWPNNEYIIRVWYEISHFPRVRIQMCVQSKWWNSI